MTLDELNALSRDEAERVLLTCCGSTRWAETMAARRPFGHVGDVLHASDELWLSLDADDWHEAFAHHPRIGERSAPATASAESARMSEQEQARVAVASPDLQARLVEGNQTYEERFGYTFIVAAAGKTAGDILAVLERRLDNDAATELRAAGDEQRKITWLRLEKLLAPEIRGAQ